MSYYVVLCYSIACCIILYYIITLYYMGMIWYYIILHCIILCYIISHYIDGFVGSPAPAGSLPKRVYKAEPWQSSWGAFLRIVAVHDYGRFRLLASWTCIILSLLFDYSIFSIRIILVLSFYNYCYYYYSIIITVFLFVIVYHSIIMLPLF